MLAAELAGLRRQFDPEVPAKLVADEGSARQFADELLATTTATVAYLGVTPFTRYLAQQAGQRDIRVVRLDAGVRVFGRPTPPHPWADSWCVAGDFERRTLLERGSSPDSVAI